MRTIRKFKSAACLFGILLLVVGHLGVGCFVLNSRKKSQELEAGFKHELPGSDVFSTNTVFSPERF